MHVVVRERHGNRVFILVWIVLVQTHAALPAEWYLACTAEQTAFALGAVRCLFATHNIFRDADLRGSLPFSLHGAGISIHHSEHAYASSRHELSFFVAIGCGT